MNKKLIAAALAGAFVAPVAMADVQIYGFISAGVEHAKATGAAGNVADKDQYEGRMRIANENSRIGFKGSEDLGNGLKAHWQVEQAINVDDSNSSSNWATRNSFIGLAGGFGDVRLGRHDDAYKLAIDGVGLNVMINTTADNGWGNTTWGRAGSRRNNTAIYFSPKFSGFGVQASYSADETRAYDGNERTDASIYALAATYQLEGLKAGLAYTRHNDTKTLANNDIDAWALALSYKFGDTMVGAGYERLDYDVKGGQDYDQASWTIAAAQQFGAFGLKASYTQLGKAKGLADADKYKANQWVLGATYDLSKRTQVLAYATRIDNKDNAAVNFGVNPVTVKAGSNPQAVGVALKHSF